MSVEVFAFICFPGDVSPERQLCHQQHKAAPLGNTRDFYSLAHFTPATQDKQKKKKEKKYTAIKKRSILSSCPLLSVVGGQSRRVICVWALGGSLMGGNIGAVQ